MKQIFFALLALFIAIPTAHAAEKKDQSVYDRVMETGTIRCGYAMWPDHLEKDPNTGEMSGIFYDYMEQLGQNLHLKIEWTEEVGWGDFVAALKYDRIDAYCITTSLNAERAREVDFVSPLFYMRSEIFVRDGDTRFDSHLEKLNDPSVTLTVVEGDIYDKISNAEYPLAKKLPLPQLASPAELFMTVADGKADATITELSGALNFMSLQPGKLRQVQLDKPFRTTPVSIAVKGGEYRFQRMLDIATIEMLSNGSFEKILEKHEPVSGLFARVHPGYEAAE